MAKIDLDKLICSLAKRKYFSEEKLQDALKEQGLEYKDGKIVQKPKFNVGDWVLNNVCLPVQIASIKDDTYIFTEGDALLVSFVNENYHLWTIEDAKDGDVLASQHNKPFIYNGNYGHFHIGSYCGISVEDRFNVATEKCLWTENVNIHPATNAQRALLFQKMKEAGYDWDADKKELKHIENTRPMLSDFFNAEYERGKASFANRQIYNRAILKLLSNYVEKYPDIRFGQMLCNLGISSKAENNFYVESSKTYQAINTILNEQENGKNRVI